MNEAALPYRSEGVRTLRAPAEIEHEYRRATCGPRGYAFVRFRCEPSSELTFHSAAKWPYGLGAEYSSLLEDSVKRGMVDAFAGAPASRVCRVVLVSVGWHDVQSSEVAFQRAATEALRPWLTMTGFGVSKLRSVANRRRTSGCTRHESLRLPHRERYTSLRRGSCG
jgi:hypothetical protein